MHRRRPSPHLISTRLVLLFSSRYLLLGHVIESCECIHAIWTFNTIISWFCFPFQIIIKAITTTKQKEKSTQIITIGCVFGMWIAAGTRWQQTAMLIIMVLCVTLKWFLCLRAMAIQIEIADINSVRTMANIMRLTGQWNWFRRFQRMRQKWMCVKHWRESTIMSVQVIEMMALKRFHWPNRANGWTRNDHKTNAYITNAKKMEWCAGAKANGICSWITILNWDNSGNLGILSKNFTPFYLCILFIFCSWNSCERWTKFDRDDECEGEYWVHTDAYRSLQSVGITTVVGHQYDMNLENWVCCYFSNDTVAFFLIDFEWNWSEIYSKQIGFESYIFVGRNIEILANQRNWLTIDLKIDWNLTWSWLTIDLTSNERNLVSYESTQAVSMVIECSKSSSKNRFVGL